MTETEYRVRVEYDDDPDLSYLEQWNTPETYAGNEHIRERFVSQRPEVRELNGKPFDLKYRDLPKPPMGGLARTCRLRSLYVITIQGQTRLALPSEVEMTFDEYMQSYGDPGRHVTLGCIVERRCACCDEWSDVGSVWGIDYMDWDNYPGPGIYELRDLNRPSNNDYMYMFGTANDIISDLNGADTEPCAECGQLPPSIGAEVSAVTQSVCVTIGGAPALYVTLMDNGCLYVAPVDTALDVEVVDGCNLVVTFEDGLKVQVA